jgi:hypothetical protein
MGVVCLLVLAGCGLLPESVSNDDPRLKPMFEAMSRVDRTKFGFTPIARDASIRVEWKPRSGYDTMLHISGPTSRTVAFRRTQSGYEWIGEQEIFQGPKTYKTPDGEFKESITITFETVPLSGHPLNTVAVDYAGEDPELAWPRQLTLADVRPWLQRWGYY